MTDDEINSSVARKLGWTECQCPAEVREEHKRYMPSKHNMPDYCHSIAAAWEVVEKLRKDNNLLVSLYIAPGQFGLTILFSDGLFKDIEYYSDTAHMAICLAFLKVP